MMSNKVLISVICLVSSGIIIGVHLQQENERKTMREGIYRDQERLKTKLDQRQQSKKDS